MKHLEFAESLRKLADFYEGHPAVPLPFLGDRCELNIWQATAENLPVIRDAFLRATGRAEKKYSDALFMLIAKFGCIDLRAVEYREKVCVRRVVSTEVKRVERQVPIAYKTEIVEEKVEQVEWDCKPLADLTSQASAAITIEGEKLALPEAK